MSNVELIVLGNGDLDRYRRLRLEALRTEPTAFGSSYETEASAKADKYRDRMQGSPENFVLGACDGDQLVGIGGFFRETAAKRQHIGSVWGLYVTSAFRGRGIGRRLLTLIVERARDLPELEHILLSVTSENAGALALYRSLGFEAWGTEPAALKYEGVDYDETHMLLRLSRQLAVRPALRSEHWVACVEQHACDRLSTATIFVVEPPELRAVQIQYTQQLTVSNQRHDQFRVRRAVARDVTREFVHVSHDDALAIRVPRSRTRHYRAQSARRPVCLETAPARVRRFSADRSQPSSGR